MNAPEALQLIVIKRLNAEADAIDAGITKRRETFSRGGFWIGLERNFGVGGEIECLSACADEASDLFSRQQRGRSPAEKDRVGLATRRSPDLRFKGRDVSALEVVIKQAAVEVAVRANRLAKGDVDVETQIGVPGSWGPGVLGLGVPGSWSPGVRRGSGVQASLGRPCRRAT